MEQLFVVSDTAGGAVPGFTRCQTQKMRYERLVSAVLFDEVII